MIVLGNAVPIILDAPSMEGKRVLDVGCMSGDNLAHPAYALARERHGVDVDAEAIKRGQWKHPDIKLWTAPAESLPFGNGYFDVVISNVALPYTDIRKALGEIHRVLVPGGLLFLTLHDWRHQWEFFNLGGWKRKLDHLYIVPASLFYIVTGIVPVRPWRKTRETFQTVLAIRRDLEGFGNVEFKRTDRDWIVTATRP